jgi:hypothetical protein
MEWPDLSPQIKIQFSQDTRGSNYLLGSDIHINANKRGMGTFTKTDKCELLPGNRYASIYELTDLELI